MVGKTRFHIGELEMGCTGLHMCQSSDQMKLNAITFMSSTHMIDNTLAHNQCRKCSCSCDQL